MTTLAHGDSNSKAVFAALLDQTDDLGRQAGQGKDSQIRFGLMILEKAHDGILDLSPNKHGDGVRDSKILGERYYKAQTGATSFDHRQPSQRKLISNIDKCIHVGMQGKWGVGQPIGIVNDMLVVRNAFKDRGEKVEDAFNTLMRFLTNLKKRDDLPTQKEIEEIVLKKEPARIDAEDVWERIKKLATGLRAGTINNCVDQDTSPEVDRVIKNAERRLREIGKLRAQLEVPGDAEEHPEPIEPTEQPEGEAVPEVVEPTHEELSNLNADDAANRAAPKTSRRATQAA